MVQREYKELCCRDLGSNCDFLVRAENEDEVMALVSEHFCRAHGGCVITPELKNMMQVPMKSVCRAGECYDAPIMTGHSYWGAC